MSHSHQNAYADKATWMHKHHNKSKLFVKLIIIKI
jgi:hypothetical protein